MVKISDMHITLCGMMGVGKSAHGRELSSLTGLPFTDLDAAIKSYSGREIPEIFKLYGETEFRRIEALVLEKLLDSESQIIALGGGALHNDQAVDKIKNKSTLCFIDASFDVILRRIQRNKKRPLLLNNSGELKSENEIAAIISKLFEKRLHLYQKADIHYRPAEGLSVGESARILYKLITEYAR
ncbi:MAG: shikimate kinase [Balneolia bacterium]|nr:shikimate kinase [Balneolia bacterium]